MPVFTQFADTSRYLKTQLTIRGFRRVEEATGESANPTELVWRFSPESNAKRHLISPLPLGEGPGVRANFSEWRKSHQPFHWFAEFYGVMREGGFDVVIGNPPYVQIRQLNNFKEGEFVTFACGNIYTLVIERCLQIISLTGKQGLIVPVSSISTEGYLSLQNMLVGVGGLVVSSFDDRPSHLFDGLDKNTLAILLSGAGSGKPVYSTRLSRWNEDEVDFIIDYDIKYRMGGAEDEE